MVHHGQLYQRDHVPPRSEHYAHGKFGRLFPLLPPFASDTPAVRQALLDAGAPGGPMDAQDPPPPTPNPGNPDNPSIPAGFTFLGQFLDHDLTFDPTSSLERQTDPESIANFRTPAFELDSLYGSGRAASPHLYDLTTGNRKLLIDAAAPQDLPRNSQLTALLGDPRNDENLIISQLHLAFLKFHNIVVDVVSSDGVTEPSQVFDEAQRLVRWHYQWMIVHEFLPKIVGQPLVTDILQRGRRFYNWRHAPFIPVEFSVSAYRFGHSMVRNGYLVNQTGSAGNPTRLPLFDATADLTSPDPDDLRGGKRADRRFVEWPLFFDLGTGVNPTFSKRIDTLLSSSLFALPFTGPNLPGNPSSLAQRNLLRHLTFSLPSGQRVARAMGEERLAPGDLSDLAGLGPLQASTPLWFYILREAHVHPASRGAMLGPVGGRIVAEVFIGMLEGDRMSYLNQDPDWVPTLTTNGRFGMADLLQVAGLVELPLPPARGGA